MASQGRFAARLARLPQETLLELAASLCCTNDATRRTADSTLALHDPTPAWAIERILTSPDLVQCIFAHVEIYDGVAAATCKAWKRGWDATDAQRRGLRPAELPEPDFEMPQYGAQLASLPGERLCVAGDGILRIVDAKMQTLHEHDTELEGVTIDATEDGLYVSVDDHPTLRRYRLEEDSSLTLTAEYEDTRDEEERYSQLWFPTPAPDGALFAVGVAEAGHDNSNDEIVAFDATTLTVRNRFGRGRFGRFGACDMALVGDELYASDTVGRCIHVFSMSGEHLREIRGDWREPQQLLFVRDRLYLSEVRGDNEYEDVPEDETAEQEKERLEAGRRIFVLTPQGETLQKYRFEYLVQTMAVLGLGDNEKLVVRSGGTLLALKGL